MNPAEYQPAPKALAPLRNVTLVAVVGPSGVGKTTLMDRAIAHTPELHFVVSDTSRSPRPHEQDGIDYFFRSREEMLGRMERGEYTQVPPLMSNDLYATAPEAFATGDIGVMAVLADAIPHFRSLPFRAMRTIFVVPPSYEDWQQRLGHGRDALHKRLAEARRSVEFGLDSPDVTYLFNENLNKAARDLVHLALARPLTPRMEVDQRRAQSILRSILQKLQTVT